MSEPSYLKLYREGVLQERAREAVERLRECRLCPRELQGEQAGGRAGRLQDGAQGNGLELRASLRRGVAARGLARLGDGLLQRLQSPLHFLPEL